jgi:hypothetical protein
MVVQGAKEIQRFHVIGTGFGWMARSDMEIAKIDECMGDGMGILRGALDLQDLTIAVFSRFEIFQQRTGISEIPERIGQFLHIVAQTIILDGSLPCCSRLSQMSPVKEDSGTVLVIL